MSEINKDSFLSNEACEKAREELDFLLEASVEARINKSLGKGAILDGVEASNFETASPILSAHLTAHLSHCQQCDNYQLANRVLIEAARAMPKLTADANLTSSIMALIDLELGESGQQFKQNIDLVTLPAASEPKLNLVRYQASFLMMAFSFIAFTAVSSGFSADGLWSSCSWLVALLIVAMLKPLVENNQIKHPAMVKA